MLNLFQYYCFLDFVTLFNIRETAKLTVAPITAKIIVFAISSERILGKTLNKVPEAVPAFKEILVSIYPEFISGSFPLLRFLLLSTCSELAEESTVI